MEGGFGGGHEWRKCTRGRALAKAAQVAVRVCASSPYRTRDFLSTWIRFYDVVKIVRRALSDVLNISIDHPKEIRKVGEEAHKLKRTG